MRLLLNRYRTRLYNLATLLVLLLLAAVILFGLLARQKDKSPPPPTVPTAFQAQAQMQFNGVSFTADIHKTDVGACTITIVDPPPLTGMRFSYDGEQVRVGYQGFSVDVGKPQAMQTVVKLLTDALDQKTLTRESTKQGTTLHGKVGEHAFTIKLDQKGQLCGLSVPEAGLETVIGDSQ